MFELSSTSGIRGLRVSPLVVDLKPKIRIIIPHLTFARPGDYSIGNDYTYFSSAPSCELGHVLRNVFLRALFSRQKHDPTAELSFAALT